MKLLCGPVGMLFLIPLLIILTDMTVHAVDTCLACTIIITIAQEIAMVQNVTGVESFDLICGALANGLELPIVELCDLYAKNAGPVVDKAIANAHSPDQVCVDLGDCDGSCTLFNTWPPPSLAPAAFKRDYPRYLLDRAAESNHEKENNRIQIGQDQDSLNFLNNIAPLAMAFQSNPSNPSRRDNPGNSADVLVGKGGFIDDLIKFLEALGGNFTEFEIDRVFSKHLPLLDDDFDGFGTDQTFRGSDWRGKDCDDKNRHIYPGVKVAKDSESDLNDYNCNGVYGINPDTNITYETEYCSGVNEPRGLIIVGDSATAHFSVPPAWLTAKGFDNSTMTGLLHLAENEFDWPACSWSTAHSNSSACPDANPLAPMKSIYQRLFERNRCMHRDYQNIGVNGASTQNANPNVDEGNILYLKRNQEKDVPALVIYAMIGNDVCSGHPGLEHMTTVEEFKQNVIASLDFLDTKLPSGSHVLFVALADGRVLYDTTHNETHPVLAPYPDVYDWLSCEESNPCWGWLNSNETWRDLTSERARNLSKVYQDIIQAEVTNQQYEHFDMLYWDPDWPQLVKNWTSLGNSAFDLIEKVDGFHPSQSGQNLLSQTLWDWLLSEHPQVLGSVNPYNDKIQELFGDQGGY